MTVRAAIDQMAELAPDRVFLIDPDEGNELTYGQLRSSAIAITRYLLQRGINKGDKVSFMLSNGSFTSKLLLGILYGGFVVVPLNTRAGDMELHYVLEHSGTKLIFASQDYAGILARIFEKTSRPVPVIRTDDALPRLLRLESRKETPAEPVMEQDDAVLIYTSGTTALPKGVLLTHRNVLSGGINTILAHELSDKDRALCVLPLSHINGQIVTLIAPLLSRGSVVMPHAFRVASFWKLLSEHSCTWFSAVPAIMSQLLHRSGSSDRITAPTPRLRFGRSASAPLDPLLHRSFEEKFGVAVVETMGLTETAAQVLAHPLPPYPRRYGSVGIPFGNEAKIVTPQGNETAAGERGEIVIRGPNVMRCYYRDTIATARAIDTGGWLHTGDIGYRDKEGFFYVTGRLKELISKGGEKISPQQIDEALCRHPAVWEAAAVGVPDPYYGQEIIAFVVLAEGSRCTEDQLFRHCVQHLGAFKTPERIRFVDALPRGATGKIQRLRLVQQPEPIRGRGECVKEMGRDTLSKSAALDREGSVEKSRASLEQFLAGVWAEVLGLAEVGVHDDFFALGGDSLLATQVMSRMRRAFHAEIPLENLFETPTVAGFAEALKKILPPET
jgi:sulfoacetate-CoA ligase